MSAPLMILGLPTRDVVRQELQLRIEPHRLLEVKWIRVAAQLDKLAYGTPVYLLEQSRAALASPEHAELRRALESGRVLLAPATPDEIAELLA